MYKINVMQVTLFDLFFSFLKLGLTAFGGPAMVAYIRELAVQKKGWVDQRTFNEGVALSQIVPGPIAMHVAGFVGVKLREIVCLVMAKINLFAFGGAYTALPLMLHEVVENMKLLDSKTFMDGIALGQVTPGPILITATFVGYLVYGLSGAILATIYVFTPSFILYLFSIKIADRIRNNSIFLKGKRGILSSFCALLLFASFKLSFTIDWNIIKLFFFIASLLVLYKGINILYVVVFGGLLSFILFR
jgi:chromate transport protein ChrA